MQVFNTLCPIWALLILGAVLGARGFVSKGFIEELNRLIYYVAMPALIVEKLAGATIAGGDALRVYGVFMLGTVACLFLGLGVAWLLKLPRNAYGTFTQAAFRGNLALIGLPVMLFHLSITENPRAEEIETVAVLTLGMIMISYNVLSIIVLQASRDLEEEARRQVVRSTLFRVIKNPLILASLTGAAIAFLQWELPLALDRSLELTAEMTVPASLICIGGRLGVSQLSGQVRPATIAALMKVALVPVLVFLSSLLLPLDQDLLFIAMVFGACPAAAASYVMASELGGDPVLASSSIFLSTILSAASLSVMLILFN